jgi:hypothetical protein
MNHFIQPSCARIIQHVVLTILIGSAPLAVASAATPPTISGKPIAGVVVGHTYLFEPTAKDSTGKALSFSIANKPAWASFSIATGKLDGTPTSQQTGSYSNIQITVGDGVSKAALAPFSIKVIAYKEPAIGGTPVEAVAAGSAYAFTPKAAVEWSLKPTFSITDKPKWATFNTSTGELNGTPTASDVGSDTGIHIAVSDGTSVASLPKFSITVMPTGTKSITLSWKAPTENANGTALTNLAGYRIQYGTNPAALSKTITINTVGRTTEVVTNLASGTYYFAILAYNTSGAESSLSNVVSAKF